MWGQRDMLIWKFRLEDKELTQPGDEGIQAKGEEDNGQ